MMRLLEFSSLKEKQRIHRVAAEAPRSNPRPEFDAQHITVGLGFPVGFFFCVLGNFSMGTIQLIHQVKKFSLICNALNFMLKSVIFLI